MTTNLYINLVYVLLPIVTYYCLKNGTNILKYNDNPLKNMVQILTGMQMLHMITMTSISYVVTIISCVQMYALYHMFGKNNNVLHNHIQTTIGILHNIYTINILLLMAVGLSHEQIIQTIIGFSHVYYLYDSILLSDCSPGTYDKRSLCIIVHHYFHPLISESIIGGNILHYNWYLVIYASIEIFHVIFTFDEGIKNRINTEHIIYSGLLYVICVLDFSIVLKISCMIASILIIQYVKSEKEPMLRNKKIFVY